MTVLAENERRALYDLRRKEEKLRDYLSRHALDERSSVTESLVYIQEMGRVLGNVKNHASAVACILAKQYLESRHAVRTYDSCAKRQGAKGLDIECELLEGGRIVGEVKTTIPYGKQKLGAAQLDSFKKDLQRLTSEVALAKYFFVLDELSALEAVAAIKKYSYDTNIQVVNLISEANS